MESIQYIKKMGLGKASKISGISETDIKMAFNDRNWKSMNFILRKLNAPDLKDKDGFKFEGNQAGIKSKFNINNKMQYYWSPLWKSFMEKKIKKVGGKCEKCGSKDNLTVHHLAYTEKWGTGTEYEDTIVVCNRCHMYLHKDKPECWEIYKELMSPIRLVYVNVKSDNHFSITVFTEGCSKTDIENYMRKVYTKSKTMQYIKNAQIVKSTLTGEISKTNTRKFAVCLLKNKQIIVAQVSEKTTDKELKTIIKNNIPNVEYYEIFTPEKVIDSNKLKQISR